MENAEQPEEDLMMDFESGIDTWIIDKDDTVGSFSSLDKTRREGKGEKIMNKENIKHSTTSSDSKSLRSFRIRKRVSYQELSSESESESNKKLDDEEHVFCKKRRSYPSDVSKNVTSPGTSVEKKKGIESLSSEEISSMLSEVDDSKDCSPGSNRERLHSIENVPSTIDNKTGDLASSPIELNIEVNCGRCEKSEYCTCDLSETKVIYGSHKNNYNKLLKRNHSLQNGASSTFIKPLELKLELKCDNCLKALEFCNCDVIEFKSLDKAHKNKIKHLFRTNYMSSHGISPASVNSKIISVNKTSKPKMKPAKPSMADNQSLECVTCGYLSAELLIYKTHQILFHSEKTELECEYCEYKTSQCASLATHIRVHFRMDCPFCDYHCSLKSSLGTHLQTYHQNAHPYNCKTCNYSCKSQSKFYDHLQIHAVKKYQCDECNKFFSSKPGLKIHVKKHLMTTNVFKCCKCDSRFSQKRSLKLHMKCHEKLNRTYVCSTCKVSFSKKYDFINHSKTHTAGPKSFKCEKCESAFSQGNHLKLHMRTHSTKDNKCKYCTFQCSDSSEIKNHICVSVNKLYNVQKRSLNFEGVQKDVKGDNIQIGTSVKEELKKVPYSDRNILNKSLAPSEYKVVNSKFDDLNKSKKTRPKVLAVRQSLRSFKTEKKNERKNSKLQNKHKNPEKRRGRPKKLVDEKNIQTCIRKNGTFQSEAYRGIRSSCSTAETSIKKQRKISKKIKKDQLSKGLEVVNLLFNKKQTMKEMLVVPVTLTNGSFIECYYQSQQPSSAASLHQNEERHLRRPSLLSCRYCNYKTNSQQLLKFHVDKNHTWDPAVVNKLFRR